MQNSVTSNVNYQGLRGQGVGRSALGNAFRSQMPAWRPARQPQGFPSGPFQSEQGAQSPGGLQFGDGALSQALAGANLQGGTNYGDGRYSVGRQSGPPAWMRQYDQRATQQQRGQDESSWLDAVRQLGPNPGTGSPAFADYQNRFNQAFRQHTARQGGQLPGNYTAWV